MSRWACSGPSGTEPASDVLVTAGLEAGLGWVRMAPKAAPPAGLSEAERSRLRVGVLVDWDFRNWLRGPVPVDMPDAVVIKGRLPVAVVSATTEAEKTEARTISSTLQRFLAVVLRFVTYCTDGPAPQPPVLGQPLPAPGPPTALHVQGHGSLDLVGRPAVLFDMDPRRRNVALEKVDETMLGFDAWATVAHEQLLCGVDIKACPLPLPPRPPAPPCVKSPLVGPFCA